MSASLIRPGDLILVTGVTGFLGSHVANSALAQGYRVRGTARSVEKVAYLQELFDYKYPGRFTTITVADMRADGAYDEAVVGVNAIAHVASWVDFKPETAHLAVETAVNGNLNILNAAKRLADPQLKSIVVTGSAAAIMSDKNDQPDFTYTYTEADWNEWAVPAFQAGGDAVKDPLVAYFASKTAAERTLWDWRKQNKPGFTISNINPAFVVGPYFAPKTNPGPAPSSLGLLQPQLFGEGETAPRTAGMDTFVDVRDVADLHLRALSNKKADGERYIAAHLTTSPADIVEIIAKNLPEVRPKLRSPANHGENKVKFDGSKATRELGLKYRDFSTSIVDSVHSLKEYGQI